MAGLQQLDQHLEDLVVLLVEPVGILAPELFRTVNWNKAATMSRSALTSRGQCQHHQHRRWQANCQRTSVAEKGENLTTILEIQKVPIQAEIQATHSKTQISLNARKTKFRKKPWSWNYNGNKLFSFLLPKLQYLFPCSPMHGAIRIFFRHHLMLRPGFKPASFRELHFFERPLKGGMSTDRVTMTEA